MFGRLKMCISQKNALLRNDSKSFYRAFLAQRQNRHFLFWADSCQLFSVFLTLSYLKKVCFANQNVIEFHVEMAEVFAVHPFKSRSDLLSDSFGRRLADAVVADVRR